MLFFDMVMAVPLLLFANLAAHGGRISAKVGGVVFGLMVPVYILWGLLDFLPLGLLVLFLLGLFGIRWLGGMRWAWFFPASLVALVAAFGIPIIIVLQREPLLDGARQAYPVVDLEKTLPAPKSGPGKIQLASGTLKHLEDLDALEVRTENFEAFRNEDYGDILRKIHTEKVVEFVNSPGFGFARLSSSDYLNYSLWKLKERDIPIPQSGQPFSSASEPQELPGNSDSPEQSGLLAMHRNGIKSFANPNGFGYVKDRNHVAMGEKHRFQEQPKAAPGFSLRRVELMGLLLFDEPVVYVSANLPRMEELRKAPTRGLDSFENKALAHMQKGSDMLAGTTPEGVRMVGAIRSAKTCVKCHGGQEGDLLGAFSYVLGTAPDSK